MPRKKKQVQEKFPYAATDIIGIEDIYSVINYIQTSRKSCCFIAKTTDSTVMENLFGDCEISFERKSIDKGIKYELMPPPIRDIPEEVFIINEDYPDEIVEDGQCF